MSTHHQLSILVFLDDKVVDEWRVGDALLIYEAHTFRVIIKVFKSGIIGAATPSQDLQHLRDIPDTATWRLDDSVQIILVSLDMI
ncbi:hypothetical protein CEXT_375561 [Caerostris extrusa]|uniref:Uncharacterized protein n=1 Tax=Caerostris extrusa TaxID=172846 RepID=A0AAV4U336_CAEEX|nr:hypothetical protein CEXT_375561 [Caerostris extrusa]